MPKAAVIGLGVGQKHCETYSQAGYAVYTADFNNGIEWRDIVDRCGVVSVASWDQYHAEQVDYALRAGKDVFCEKPLCLVEDDLLKMKKHVTEGRRLGSSLPLRHHPPFLEIKHNLERLGEIYHISASYNYGRLHKLNGWRAECPGYSVVLGGAIHMIDLVMWLLQDKPSLVSAFGNSHSGFQNHDTVTSILKFPNTTAQITVNCGYEGIHAHCLTLWGSEGTATITNTDPTDKTLALKAWLDGEDTDVFSPMHVAFAIERASHSGEVERVNY